MRMSLLRAVTGRVCKQDPGIGDMPDMFQIAIAA
jgi:hypothetical protein